MSEAVSLRWHVYPEVSQVVAAAVRMVEFAAAGAIAVRGRFSIVLAGGTTPRPIYERLAGFETDWSRWHIWFSDERCLPSGHTDRNDTMARAVWLDRVPIPRAQVYSIPAELGAAAGAEAYQRQLTGEPPFDVALLGLGEDGHTASLFPGRPVDAAPESEPGTLDVMAVHDAPKPPPERVTLTAARLARSEHIALVVLGASKARAVAKLREGADIPPARLGHGCTIDVLADRQAAGSER